jgi:hypothetical protein
MITLAEVHHLTGGRLGIHDVACPECGPTKRSARNQRKPIDPEKLAHARAEAAARDRLHRAQRLRKARWLWGQRHPIGGSIPAIYLRGVRGYAGLLPATLGFLPARDDHTPAMIAAFGMATEIEPGVIAIPDSAVMGGPMATERPAPTPTRS